MSVPTHTPTLVFGREPAAWTAAIMSAVALVVAFGINVSTETQGIIQAFVNALLSLIVVITVRETVLPAIVGVIGTGLPVLVAFGFDLTDQQQGAILAAAPLVLGLLVTRPQVTPTVNALDGRRVIEGEVVLESAGIASQVADQISGQLDELIHAVKDGKTMSVVVENDKWGSAGPASAE